MPKFNDRTGEISANKFGTKMRIIEYENNRRVLVEFQDEYKYRNWVSYEMFKKGGVRNPYNLSVEGVGYIGVGFFQTAKFGRDTKEYVKWHSMFQRCYSKSQKQFSYMGCTVAPEWHNFQNFAEWYKENFYHVPGEKMEIDKNILVKGNKIYGPETCVFVPNKINTLFIKNNNRRGAHPIGVCFDKDNKKFKSACGNTCISGKNLGLFNTREQAFCAYKKYKEELIKNMAEKYKGKIPENLYTVLINYEVEIGD